MTQADTRKSWIASANGHPDFPLQNLPLGVFSTAGGTPRGGVAIGEHIFDLKVAADAGLFTGEAKHAALAASGTSLNAFFALGAGPRRALREQLQAILAEGSEHQVALEVLGDSLLPLQIDCQLLLPAQVGDYTDFYVGIHHANNVGRLFRPDNPLLPNYKHVPIGYHGRASTVVASGCEVRRPNGQTLAPGAEAPSFGPSKRLDYELELGIWIGQGNAMGDSIAIGAAEQHVAGFCLLNDWSARDVQGWEYQPLGPFLSKNFATTISPWVVTPEALAPFRVPFERAADQPQPLPYLDSPANRAGGAFDIVLEVGLQTAAMRAAGVPHQRLMQSNFRDSYWTVAQLITHHTIGGCNLGSGDLLGSGTQSGPGAGQGGSLLELSEGGRKPITLANGETRTFLRDGDSIALRAHCARPGARRIGFGRCEGHVLAAVRPA